MRWPSMPSLILKRLANDWRLLLSVFTGITIATSLGAGAPVYLASLDQLAFGTSLDRLSAPFLSFHVIASDIPLTRESLDRHEESLDRGVDRHISRIYRGREVYFKGDDFLVWTRPVGERGTAGPVSRGYFQYLSNLEGHSRFLQGRMPASLLGSGERGPVVEAAVSEQTAEEFDLAVGDHVNLAPTPSTARVISALIVGILEPADPAELIWSRLAIVLDPSPPLEGAPPGTGVDPDDPPVALFLVKDAMLDVVGEAYPGILVKVNPIWFIAVETERIKDWPMAEARRRLDDFEREIGRAVPESSVATGLLGGLIDDIERRSFFARVPLLLLMALMLVTVLFHLFLLISYLVQRREAALALLRTRGATTFQLVRLDALEGLAMISVAVALAPFLAMGAVALAGKLPHFAEMTGGRSLPLHLGPEPFLFGAAAGVLCLLTFVIPGAMGARRGLVLYKLRASRPPTLTFFHRYYLDVGLVVVGALVFGEFQSRGQLISGGLFKDVSVNEASLFAPVLFLALVALVFMRFFPLLLRFVSGESPAVVHILAAVSVLWYSLGVAVAEWGAGWAMPSALSLGVGVAYWLANRSGPGAVRLFGLVLQAGLVAGLIALRPPGQGELLFFPTVGLVSVVLAQLAFMLLRASIRSAPVWLSVGLWHMARSPMQYAWLVLLLVLAIGLGILSTTVGGTLERSERERILYDIPSDLLVRGGRLLPEGGLGGLRDRLVDARTVRAGSLALRASGSLGASGIQVLALEPTEFANVAWYRDDFSVGSLAGLMAALQPRAYSERVKIPDGATSVGLWIRPIESQPLVSVWVAVQGAVGTMRTLMLGQLGETAWHRLSVEIPDDLQPPLHLVSVQLYEPSSIVGVAAYAGPSGAGGTVLLDNIHAMVGGEAHLLEDFESPLGWTPIATSLVSSDSLSTTEEGAFQGRRAGVFTFGRHKNMSVRGIYRSLSGGPIPVVIGGVDGGTAYRVGDTLMVRISSRLTPVVVRGTASYFPTMDPDGGAFLIADLDQLLGYINMMGQLSTVEPNELYIRRADGADRATGALLDELSELRLRVEDGAAQLEALRLNPLATAGWRTMVLLGLAIVLLTAASGYVSYLLYYASRTRGTLGSLRSLGLSRAQLLRLLGLEHLTIGVVGLGLGTWAGIQVSRLMVEPLAITETGERVFPPFALTTDWGLLLPVYGAVVIVFLAAIFVLSRDIRRSDLSESARVEA